MTTQGLDFPDGPGWWGYKGELQGVVHFTEFEVDNDTVTIRWGDDDYAIHYDLAWFKRSYRDMKWYRLHMPWEQPAPAAPTMPDEVREAIEDVLRYGVSLPNQNYTNESRYWGACNKVRAWLDAEQKQENHRATEEI